MISICIPVYNTDVCDLVEHLHTQILILETAFEIVVVDDGSAEFYKQQNQQITKFNTVKYFESSFNKGRIEARNKLGAFAKFDWLLFIDADSTIISKYFLLSYLTACTKDVDAIIGGRVYQNEPPADCRLKLHWRYGRQRENATKGRFVFMTNNFCIRKSIFKQLEFPPILKGYGHEDTWLGMQLIARKVRIRFIENPVLHNGLENAIVFIEKSKNALQNLKVLENISDKKTLTNHVKIFKYYNLIQSSGLSKLLMFIGKTFRHFIMKNLISCRPNLFLFDLFRLSYLLSLKNHK